MRGCATSSTRGRDWVATYAKEGTWRLGGADVAVTWQCHVTPAGGGARKPTARRTAVRLPAVRAPIERGKRRDSRAYHGGGWARGGGRQRGRRRRRCSGRRRRGVTARLRRGWRAPGVPLGMAMPTVVAARSRRHQRRRRRRRLLLAAGGENTQIRRGGSERGGMGGGSGTSERWRTRCSIYRGRGRSGAGDHARGGGDDRFKISTIARENEGATAGEEGGVM